jgi:hypothetical protein
LRRSISPKQPGSIVPQPKSGASQPKANHRTAPPVYRPQPTPRVLQTKAARTDRPQTAQPKHTPIAPPVYRPQPVPKVLQAKQAVAQPSTRGQSTARPVAPPAYRPQPLPSCLQTKTARSNQPPNARLKPKPIAASGDRRQRAPLVQAPSQIMQLKAAPSPLRARPPVVVQKTGQRQVQVSPPVARSTTQVIQRDVAKDTEAGTPVIVTNPMYKMKYRTAGRVVRPSRQDGYLVVAFDDIKTPEDADGFRLHISDLDYAPGKNEAISVTPFGKQTFILVGTSHGHSEKLNISKDIHHELLANSTLILEYPPLTETGKKVFDSNVFADLTQNSLAATASKQKGIVIGADARKAFDDEDVLHAISIRHKTDKQYEINVKDRITKEQITEAAIAYVEYCLGFSNGQPPPLGTFISDFIQYKDGTKLLMVIGKATLSIRAKAESIEKGSRIKVAQAVLKHLDEDLESADDEYTTYAPHCKKEQDRIGLVLRANQEFVGALYDSICNLLLLTEAFTAKTRKVLVAFGGEHTKLFEDMFK